MASLGETIERFGTGSHQRKLVAARLRRIYEIASNTTHLARFIVFGSFVTEKREPNDVDVFMIMDDAFDVSSLIGEARILFHHGTAQDHFGASVFWVRRLAALGGEEAAIKDWQIKRDGTERGIVEITAERS
jgi:predicted nucleotidyltransferase